MKPESDSDGDENGAVEMSALEVKTERDYDLLGKRDIVRVLYRPTGSRGRWTRFVIVPDEGQTIEELREAAPDIAEIHHGRLYDSGGER